MINENVNVDDIEMIMEDITKRNDGKTWETMNYTDKYNMIICSRALKKHIDEYYNRLTQWANIPLEYIQNERIKQVQADKFSLKSLLNKEN